LLKVGRADTSMLRSRSSTATGMTSSAIVSRRAIAASAAASERRTDWSVRGTVFSRSRKDMSSISSTLRPSARAKRADTFWKANVALVCHSQSASLLSYSRSSRLTVSSRSSSA
jgi:hypothetical protein